MVESLESALKMVESLFVDDCTSLTKVFLADYARIAELNDAIKTAGNASKEFYIGPDKYKFVNSKKAKELIDFVVKNYVFKEQVSDKLLNVIQEIMFNSYVTLL
jgi:hypothetical protein